mmetsp:Transcript_13963/g.29196  ORF Transcript_13963/g.29196 Transcript_13963/m.29196 type:complete len:986 (+) Transcript_13963:98-3055(+)
MMRRVSSRRRLVSDADEAFRNANVETDEVSSVEGVDVTDAALGGVDGREGVPPNPLDDMQEMTFLQSSQLQSSQDVSSLSSAFHRNGAESTPNGHANISSPPTGSFADDSSDYFSCQDDGSNHPLSRSHSMVNLHNSFSKKASLSSILDICQIDGVGDVARAVGSGERGSIDMDQDDYEEEAMSMSEDGLFLSAHVIPTSSSSEDDDALDRKMPATLTNYDWHRDNCSNHGISTVKRKRLSNRTNVHKMKIAAACKIPLSMLKSPYALSHNAADLHATAKNASAHACNDTSESQKNVSMMLNLPEETIVLIASHLPLSEIRILSSTNTLLRRNLVLYRGSVEGIWMEDLRGKFPDVFAMLNLGDLVATSRQGHDGARDCNGSTRQVASFVDDCRLPTAGLSPPHGSKVNLPLLTGLTANRYPQSIDPKTMNLAGHRFHRFRKFELDVPVKTFGCCKSKSGDTDDLPGRNEQKMINIARSGEGNTAAEESEAYAKKEPKITIPVYQFTGQVGSGDRCLRSDKPFPPTCKASPFVDLEAGRGTRFCSLSQLLKPRGGGKKKTKKRQGEKTKVSRTRAINAETGENNSSTSGSLYESFTRRGQQQQNPHLQRATSLPNPHQQNSPLSRFLSSLSHYCDGLSESSSEDDTFDLDSFDSGDGIHRGYQKLDRGNSNEEEADSDDDDDDDDNMGVNNYGIIKSKLNRYKQRLHRLSQCHRNKDDAPNLRPFVAPTVLSETYDDLHPSKRKEQEPKLVVDVTPRLVAYFEVTILEHSKETSPPRPQHQQQRNPPPQDRWQPRQGHHQRQQLHRQYLHHNMHLRFHRVFPPMHLPLPLDMVADLEHFQLRQPAVLPPRFRHRVQRHECLAIGLSNHLFCPRDKMPGWDEHSYGYHGDDGCLFHGHGTMVSQYGPLFGPGDTVGCGLEYSTRRIFFVWNGNFLGYAFDEISEDVIDGGLFPTVGVDTECPLHINFGNQPFKFDLRGFVRNGCGL